MKTKRTSKLKQKIIIPILLILSLNFIMPNFSNAGIGLDTILISPITGLVTMLGDGINSLMQTLVAKNDDETWNPLKVNESDVYLTAENNNDKDKAKIEQYIKDSAPVTGSNIPTKEIDADSDVVGNFGIPNIIVSPAEIFSNKLSLLDANYFEDNSSNQYGGSDKSTVRKLKSTVSKWYNTLQMVAVVGLLSVLVYVGIRMVFSATGSDKAKYKSMFTDWLIALFLVFCLHYIMVFTMTIVGQITSAISGAAESNNVAIGTNSANLTPLKQVNVTITGNSLATKLFGIESTAQDAKQDSNSGNLDVNLTGEAKHDVLEVIKKQAGGKYSNIYVQWQRKDGDVHWYCSIYDNMNPKVEISNSSIVSVITAQEGISEDAAKAKIKNDTLNEAFGADSNNKNGDAVGWPQKIAVTDFNSNIKDLKNKYQYYYVSNIHENTLLSEASDSSVVSSNGTTSTVSFATNLIGYVRLGVENTDAKTKLANAIMYLALTFFTIYFVFAYLKRLIMLTFLTIIAPLVALTYPIDKIKDGKAQAFDYWLHEYIMNAILPVIHLTLYVILIGSAIDLCIDAPIYALCALGFLMPAEKIIRSMFGIKAETAPGVGGFAGGALAAGAISKVANGFLGKSGAKPQDKIRTADAAKNIKDTEASDRGKALFKAGGAGENAQGGNNPIDDQRTNGEENQIGETENVSSRPRLENALARYAAQQPGASSGARLRAQLTQNRVENQRGQQQSARNATLQEQQARGAERTDQPRENQTQNGKPPSHFSQLMHRKFNAPYGQMGRAIAKGASRKALKAVMIGTGAAVGLAGGLVTGNPKDVAAGITGGAVAGNLLGGKIAGGAGTLAKGIRRDFDTLVEGEPTAQLLEQDREFYNDADTREYLARQGNNKEQIDTLMKEYAQYNRMGVTDPKSLGELHDINEQYKSNGRTPEDAMDITKYIAEAAVKAPDSIKSSEEAKQDYIDYLAKNKFNHDRALAEDLVNKIINVK